MQTALIPNAERNIGDKTSEVISRRNLNLQLEILRHEHERISAHEKSLDRKLTLVLKSNSELRIDIDAAATHLVHSYGLLSLSHQAGISSKASCAKTLCSERSLMRQYVAKICTTHAAAVAEESGKRWDETEACKILSRDIEILIHFLTSTITSCTKWFADCQSDNKCIE